MQWNTNGATEDICNNAVVLNSNKRCVLQSDKKGCQEIDYEYIIYILTVIIASVVYIFIIIILLF